MAQKDMEPIQMITKGIAAMICLGFLNVRGHANGPGLPFKDDAIFKTSSRSYRFKPADLGAEGLRVVGNTYEEVIVFFDWKTGEPRGGRWRNFYQDGEGIRDDDVMVTLSTIGSTIERNPEDQFIRSQFPNEVPSWIPNFRQFEASPVPWWRPADKMYFINHDGGWLAFTCANFLDNLSVCSGDNQWDRDKWFSIKIQEKLLPRWREVFRASLEWVERHAVASP